jgi:hypothetical protein
VRRRCATRFLLVFRGRRRRHAAKREPAARSCELEEAAHWSQAQLDEASAPLEARGDAGSEAIPPQDRDPREPTQTELRSGDAAADVAERGDSGVSESEEVQKLKPRLRFLGSTIDEWREQAEDCRKRADAFGANRWLPFTDRELDVLAGDIEIAQAHHVPGLHPPLDMHIYDEIRTELERRGDAL